MKPHRGVVFLLVFCASLPLHAKDKKPLVPAVFGQARYVYVEAMDGQEFDPNLNPEDRIAIADMRDALERWHRYILTTARDQADLVIVVRRGRAASAKLGVAPPVGGGRGQIGNGRTSAGDPTAGDPIGASTRGPGIDVGGEVGPADDLFEVCPVNENGRRSSALWERTMPDGLSAPRVMLLQQFKDAVEKAYPSQPQQGQAKKP